MRMRASAAAWAASLRGQCAKVRRWLCGGMCSVAHCEGGADGCCGDCCLYPPHTTTSNGLCWTGEEAEACTVTSRQLRNPWVHQQLFMPISSKALGMLLEDGVLKLVIEKHQAVYGLSFQCRVICQLSAVSFRFVSLAHVAPLRSRSSTWSFVSRP